MILLSIEQRFTNLISKYLAIHPFVTMFFTGLEGSGKSSGLEVLEQSHWSVGVIYFSKVLAEFIDTQECTESFRPAVIADAKAKMAVRSKDIDIRLIILAIRKAAEEAVRKGNRVIIFDGFPRTPQQATLCQSILEAYMPKAKYLVVEADCPADIAFDRCVNGRRKATDTAENIISAHKVFAEHRPHILRIMNSYARHILYSTNCSQPQSLENLFSVLAFEHLRCQQQVGDQIARSEVFA